MPLPDSLVQGRGKSLVVLTGDLGGANASRMRVQILTALEGAPHDLTVDMRGIQALSSETFAVLVGAKAWQKSRKKRLTLICPRLSPTASSPARTGMHGRFLTAWDPPEPSDARSRG
jgi:anti-anti-sigma regulatory factor